MSNLSKTAFLAEKVIDPVCGRRVIDGSEADHQVAHKGNIYHFCEPGCKKAFADNPEKYIRLLRFASHEW
ncbi:MAG: YHS domain-containing protein [Betaproteobacteria bacterium]|nr:YHS domain-containing protein [Betaproteobacteria bacterium]